MNVADQIRKCKAKIADLEFNLAVERAVFTRLSAIDNSGQIATQDESRPIIADSIVPHIKSVLMNSLLPMRTKEVVAAIQKQGIRIEGKTEPKRLISSALTRRKDLFERVSRGRYRLRARTDETTKITQEQ